MTTKINRLRVALIVAIGLFGVTLVALGVSTRRPGSPVSPRPVVTQAAPSAAAHTVRQVAEPRPAAATLTPGADDPGKDLRRRSPAVTHAWAAIVALANVSSQRRGTMRHLRAGKIVLADRYSLDSTVHLRYRYGAGRKFRVQAWLVRVLSPRPVRSFWMAVPPETALARKAEQYDIDQLTLQTSLYEEEYRRLRVRKLDGTRPREELCDEIAREVWAAL